MSTIIEARKAASGLTLCALCGHSYGESAHSGCKSCPLNDGCLMTCCPNCGYSAPDPTNSKLLAAARKLRRPRDRTKQAKVAA